MIAKEQLASWDEAAANVPFPVHEPAYMPAGYRQKSLVFAYPDGPPEYKMRSATLYAEYVHEDGRDLRVNQGYGVGAAAEHLVAPEQYRGTVAIGTTTVYWINGNRLWEYRGNVGYPLEVWDESSVGSFTAYWQAPQDGTARLGNCARRDGELSPRRWAAGLPYLRSRPAPRGAA